MDVNIIVIFVNKMYRNVQSKMFPDTHLIGDKLLQNNSLITHRRNISYSLISHESSDYDTINLSCH